VTAVDDVHTAAVLARRAAEQLRDVQPFFAIDLDRFAARAERWVTAVRDRGEHDRAEADAQPAATRPNSANTVRTGVAAVLSISALAREYVPLGDNAAAVARILEAVPGAKPESVAATVRRERKRLEQTT
jgi:hypothetical protein